MLAELTYSTSIRVIYTKLLTLPVVQMKTELLIIIYFSNIKLINQH